MLYLLKDLSYADYAATGNANDYNLGPVNQLLLHKLADGPAITALYHDTYLLFERWQIAGQILDTERIPNDLVDLVRTRNKAWRGMERIETLLISYDHIHVLEYIGYDLFQFIKTHGCASLPEWSGPNPCICLVKSVTVCCHRCPSEADIHV